jgi:hypothetical protein
MEPRLLCDLIIDSPNNARIQKTFCGNHMTSSVLFALFERKKGIQDARLLVMIKMRMR